MHKLTVVLAVACLIQALHCLPVDDITPETRKKLADATAAARKAERDSLQKIEDIRGVIGRKIKKALRPIEQQLDALKEEAQKAEKDARKAGINIEECLDEERNVVHHLDDDDVKACKKTEETKQALNLVDEIRYQIQRLHQAVAYCGENYVDINDCVGKNVDDVNATVTKLQKKIKSLLGKSKPEDQDECISKGVKKLKTKLNKTTKKFRACVAALYPVTTAAPSL